jgi:hypothetical protein
MDIILFANEVKSLDDYSVACHPEASDGFFMDFKII